jgi:hypothetical protein
MSQPEDTQSSVDINLDETGVTPVSEVDETIIDSAEAATEPGRNVEHIASTFNKVHHGDKVKLIYGTSDFKLTFTGEVVGIKGQNSSRPPDTGWTKTVEVLGPEGDEKKGRLYRMGAGGDKADPWLIYSYEYYPKLDMLEVEDGAWHGWLVDVQRVPDGWE